MAAGSRADAKKDDGILKINHTLTLKDLITIVSVAVTFALAWGVFGTRITVLEKEVIALKEVDAKNSASAATFSAQLRKLETRQQDDQQFIDDIYRVMKKPLPRRTADY